MARTLTPAFGHVTTGYMKGDSPDEAQEAAPRRSVREQIQDLNEFVFSLIERTNNLDRQVHKLEEWCYRWQGDVKLGSDSIGSINAWRQRMEAQQAALSPLIRFGTSTWAYEGWQGIVYHQRYDKRRFKQDCLAEYARYTYRGYPLFRTVGLDLTFYGPPSVELLGHYAQQLPQDFEMCSKVWEEITIPRFADHPRYGAKAGQPNPRFLDANVFADEVLPPL